MGAGHPTFAAIVNVLVSITVHFIPLRPPAYLSVPPPPTLTSPSGPRAPDACREHSIAYALTSTPSLFLRLRLRPSTFDLVHLEAACRTLRATEVRGRPSASSPFVSAQLSSRAGSPLTASGASFIHSFIHPFSQSAHSYHICTQLFLLLHSRGNACPKPLPRVRVRQITPARTRCQPTSDPHPASETHPTPTPTRSV